MRKCENCSKLDGKDCAAGFSPIISEKTGAILRPARCKKKYKTTKRQYALTWKKALAKLDDEFQMYIRWRDGWTCKTCGKSADPNNSNAKARIHAGHYISRKYLTLRHDEKNCHAQCSGCNCAQNYDGIDPRYTAYVIGKYGADILDYFAKNKHSILKLSAVELEEKAAYFKKKREEQEAKWKELN